MISLIWLLIYIVILALVIYTALWAITKITGEALPAKIVQLIWVVFVLVVLAWVLTFLLRGGPLYGPI